MKESNWSLMHPLVLFHVMFYFIANASDHGRMQLTESGVLDVLVKEIEILLLIPVWHKVVYLLYIDILKTCTLYVHVYQLPCERIIYYPNN